MIVSGRIN